MIPKPRSPSPHRGAYRALLTLILLFDILIVLVHLWGRVQIDFTMRKNGRLLEKKRMLQAEVDDLSAQIDNMKSCQRIVNLAKEQGLVFVSANRLEDLPVDLNDIRRPDSRRETGVAYAGMAFFDLKPQTSDSAGRADVR
jgi:hypothetical protein